MSCLNAWSYGFYVELEDVFHERRQLSQVEVVAPVVAKVTDERSPTNTRQENLLPWSDLQFDRIYNNKNFN